MEKRKNKAWMPFLFLGIAYLLLHLLLPHIRDDMVIEQGMEFTSVTPSYVKYLMLSKYGDWSSRIFINVMTLVMGKLPHLVWILLDTAMVVLTVFSISELTRTKECRLEEIRRNAWIVALFMLYPFSHMSTAGWKATTVTYLWALGCGLYAMLPLARWLRGEKNKVWEYPLFLLAALYGANQEQMAAVLTGIYGCALLYGIWNRKKGTGSMAWICVVQFAVSFISFLSALLSPGNAARVSDETGTWFADYASISLIQKLEIGVSSAGYELFYRGNLLFLVFAGILLLLVWRKYQDTFYRVLGAIPFTVSLVMGPLSSVLEDSIPGIANFKEALGNYGTITVENYTVGASYLPLMVTILVIGAVLISLYLVYENSWNTGLMWITFLFGYASRVVLAFSPTVWASSYRTYLFLYMAVLVLGVFEYQELLASAGKEEKWILAGEKILYGVAAVSLGMVVFA